MEIKLFIEGMDMELHNDGWIVGRTLISPIMDPHTRPDDLLLGQRILLPWLIS